MSSDLKWGEGEYQNNFEEILTCGIMGLWEIMRVGQEWAFLELPLGLPWLILLDARLCSSIKWADRFVAQ